jgi:hypothetical protein
MKKENCVVRENNLVKSGKQQRKIQVDVEQSQIGDYFERATKNHECPIKLEEWSGNISGQSPDGTAQSHDIQDVVNHHMVVPLTFKDSPPPKSDAEEEQQISDPPVTAADQQFAEQSDETVEYLSVPPASSQGPVSGVTLSSSARQPRVPRVPPRVSSEDLPPDVLAQLLGAGGTHSPPGKKSRNPSKSPTSEPPNETPKITTQAKTSDPPQTSPYPPTPQSPSQSVQPLSLSGSSAAPPVLSPHIIPRSFLLPLSRDFLSSIQPPAVSQGFFRPPDPYPPMLDTFTSLGPLDPSILETDPPPSQETIESLINQCTEVIPPTDFTMLIPLPSESFQLQNPPNSITQEVLDNIHQSPFERFKEINLHGYFDYDESSRQPILKYESGSPCKKRRIWRNERMEKAICPNPNPLLVCSEFFDTTSGLSGSGDVSTGSHTRGNDPLLTGGRDEWYHITVVLIVGIAWHIIIRVHLAFMLLFILQ